MTAQLLRQEQSWSIPPGREAPLCSARCSGDQCREQGSGVRSPRCPAFSAESGAVRALVVGACLRPVPPLPQPASPPAVSWVFSA